MIDADFWASLIIPEQPIRGGRNCRLRFFPEFGLRLRFCWRL